MSLRILFVTDAGDSFVNMWEPIGLMQLTAICKNEGHAVRFGPASFRRLARVVGEFRPDVIGYSVPSCYLSFTKRLNTALKRRFDFVSVFGGKHPTIVPEMIETDSDIDAVAMGEADATFPAFLNAMESGGAYEETDGFWVRRNGQIHKNPRAPLPQDLNALPFLDREAVYEVAPYRGNPIKGFLAERGCPYKCTYCFNRHFRELYGNMGKTIRYRSVENLVDEIRKVRRDLGLEMVYFFDDVFSSNVHWLKEFGDLYRREVNLPFAITHRLDFLSEPVLSALVESGCHVIFTGIEAGNSKVRYELLGRPMPDQLILERARAIRSAGIKLVMLNLLAVPDTSLEDDLATYRMNLQCEVNYAHSAVFQPYPGTILTDLAIRQGYFTGTTEDLTPADFLKGRSRLNLPERKARQRLDSLFSSAVHLKMRPETVRFLVRFPLGPLFRVARLALKTVSARGDIFPVSLPFRTKIGMARRILRTHL